MVGSSAGSVPAVFGVKLWHIATVSCRYSSATVEGLLGLHSP